MKKQPSLIIFPGGAYGNFLGWCCCNFNITKNKRLPLVLTDAGAAHNHCSNRIHIKMPRDYNKLINTKQLPLVTVCHPLILHWDLSRPIQDFANVIYIYSTYTSTMQVLNNKMYKVISKDFENWCQADSTTPTDFFIQNEFSKIDISLLYATGTAWLRIYLDSLAVLTGKCSKWNKSSFSEMELWELREFCSQYFYNSVYAHITTEEDIASLKNKYPSVLYIDVDNLRSNFNNTINAVLAKCNIPLASNEELNALHKEWLPKQQHINADIIIEKIVSAIINNDFLDWQDSKVTFFDEFCIQRRLYDANIEIKCYKLDIFPTNTDDFEHYLIRP